MAISIGHKGYLNLISADEGPRRMIRIISFTSPGDTGPIVHDQFEVGKAPAVIIDMDTQDVVTTSFKTGVSAAHAIRHQSDTGVAAAISGHTCWAIVADTGTDALT